METAALVAYLSAPARRVTGAIGVTAVLAADAGDEPAALLATALKE